MNRYVVGILTAGMLMGCPPGVTPDSGMTGGGTGAGTTGGGGGMTGGGGGGGTATVFLRASSKSSTIALSDDDALVSMVNPEDNSLSTFSTSTSALLSRVSTGLREPAAVVYSPNRTSAWVSNRGDSTVRRINNLNTATPTSEAAIAVGSEPTGLALSPTGRFLVVAEFGEARVSVIDTTTNTIVSNVVMRNPRAVAISNDLDGDDSDERVVVTEFYGRPNANREGTDNSRTGAVRVFTLSASGTLTPDVPGEITFAPGADGGFGVGYAPNQLFAVAIQSDRIYVPSISASPAGPPTFDKNVNPTVLVATLSTKTELTTAQGSQSLAPLVAAFPAPRIFMADLVDISFFSTTIAYAIARGGEAMVRMDYAPASGLALGAPQANQIDLVGNATLGNCFNPTGVVVSSARGFAFVNCWGSQRLGIVTLPSQELTSTVVSVPPPPAGAPEQSINRGRHFFFTGRSRWSNNGWSSCASCHPDGLSDNITWIFAAGPRQSTSMDGSFSKGPTQKQRIFNWTGIIDEMHDFEGNTRNVQGGRGAVTTAAAQGDCGNLALEHQVGTGGVVDAGLPTGLGQSMKQIADGIVVRCAPNQWDDIDNYAKTIRPPRARTTLNAAAVTAGFGHFQTGICHQCHGGAGWTVSRRFYTPSNPGVIGTVAATQFVRPSAWPTSWTQHNTTQIAVQPGASELNGVAVAPGQIACAIRNIVTFGVPGDVAATDVLELKPGTGGRAQGRGGYNVPSLYGLQVAAPLLHHGQSSSLTDLFTDTRWDSHTNAGNANFKNLLDTTAGMRSELVEYLWSIDATKPEVATASGFDTGCAP